MRGECCIESHSNRLRPASGLYVPARNTIPDHDSTQDVALPAGRRTTVSRVASSPAEQDSPAAAIDKSGNVWLAYMEFKHHPRHDELRAPLKEAAKDFSPYKEAPGGDQILLRKNAGGVWGEPIAITKPG